MKSLTKGFTLIELMIVVAIIGILSAIAIPNFIKFQSRAKQSEAKANLKGLFTAQKAYFQEKDTYSNQMIGVGFQPERGNRYSYDLSGDSGPWQDRTTSVLSDNATETGVEADTFRYGSTSGISAIMTNAITTGVVIGALGSFTGGASGNIDSDPTLDQWSISSIARISAASSDATTSCAAGNMSGGEPCNDFNDV